MASTLSAIVVDLRHHHLYYSNIGDSRIYELHRGNFSQLTKDDSFVTKERIFANGGFRMVDKHTLTKAMGQEKIEINVTDKPVHRGEVIILATDGFYEARKASFTKIMEQLETSVSFEDDFRTIIDKFEILRGDDLTVVMIKIK